MKVINYAASTFRPWWLGVARRNSEIKPPADPIQTLRSSLYGNGEVGAFLVPEPEVLGEPSTWQTSAGTTLVDAGTIGPAGRVADQSGNGHFATQATASARPSYPGLMHDGTDDHLVFDTLPPPGTEPFFVTRDVRPTNLGSGNDDFRSIFSFGRTGAGELLLYFTKFTMRLYVDGGAVDIQTATTYENNGRYIVTAGFDGTKYFLRVNGIEIGQAATAALNISTPIRARLGAASIDDSATDRYLKGVGNVFVYRVGDNVQEKLEAAEEFMRTQPYMSPVSDILVPDAIWSWWANPCLLRQGDNTYVTFSQSNGAVGLAVRNNATKALSRHILSTDFSPDDHNTGAIVADGNRVLALYPGRKRTAGDIDSLYYAEFADGTNPENASFGVFSPLARDYPNAYNADGQMLVFARLDKTGVQWRYQITPWPYDATDIVAPATLFSSVKEWPYITSRRSRVDSSVINIAQGWHPNNEPTATIHYGSFHRNGVTNPWDVIASGSVVANLTTGVGLPLTESDLELVYTPGVGEKSRLFDVHDETVVFAVFTTAGSDATYFYASKATGTWVTEAVANGGMPVNGAGNQDYYGGMSIDDSDPTKITLSREVDNYWVVERMQKVGPDWVLLNREFMPYGTVKARPRSEALAENEPDTAVLHTLHFTGRYSPTDFTAFSTSLVKTRG